MRGYNKIKGDNEYAKLDKPYLLKIQFVLKQLKKEKQLTTKQVIQNIGHCGRFITGRNINNFRFATLKKLCDFYNIKVSDFFKQVESI